MDTTTFEAEFWRWFLQENFTEFETLPPHQLTLNNQKNLFTGQKYDLTIDLAEGICTDSEGNRWRMAEYIALKNDATREAIEMQLEVEHARWQEQKKAQQRSLAYIRDTENYCWKKRTGEDSFEEVTDYDIIINSVIESYDLKMDKWNRKFECTLRWQKLGKLWSKEIELTPQQTHSFNNFSEAIWEEATIRTKNLKNDEMRSFWDHLEKFYKPRVVREFKYYGFIEFEDEKYFLADNVLIKFPDTSGQPLELIAKQNGAFPVKENKYVKASEDIIRLPNFDLGVPQNGQYKAAMNRMLNDQLFEKKLKSDVIEEFCGMVGGQSEFRQWGKLIVAYVFSYLFFEDIYERFNHTIFLYFFGQGNVGKGEVVKRIFDFYGISYQDSLNTPKARSVDNAIEQKSQIPLWIDEHVPDVPGHDTHIPDQEWNSWFELKMRQTNIQKGVSYAIERKEVRTMPVFCSNFRPKSDHLLSRCLIVEYKRERRGPEKHVYNLKNNKELLQRLMLSFMQKYKLLNRKAFQWDISRVRDKLKKRYQSRTR